MSWTVGAVPGGVPAALPATGDRETATVAVVPRMVTTSGPSPETPATSCRRYALRRRNSSCDDAPPALPPAKGRRAGRRQEQRSGGGGRADHDRRQEDSQEQRRIPKRDERRPRPCRIERAGGPNPDGLRPPRPLPLRSCYPSSAHPPPFSSAGLYVPCIDCVPSVPTPSADVRRRPGTGAGYMNARAAPFAHPADGPDAELDSAIPA